MVSKKMAELLSEQVNKEIQSAYIYFAMEQYLANSYDFSGFEHFMKKQAEEEIEHTYKMMNLLHSVDKKVELKAIPQPPTAYSDFIDVFKKAYEHEQYISKSIIELLETAIAEKDYATENFLRHFVDEQVEEEDNFRKIVETLDFINGDINAVMNFNLSLGQR